MDFKQIHELIKIINKSNIGEISIEDKGGNKLTIKQKEDHIVAAPIVAQQPIYAPPAPTAPMVAATDQSLAPSPTPKATDNVVTIKSPMIGTFYRKPAPDKPNFVEIGSEIKVGNILCVVEAMKLFNNIESEVAGKIVKILVEDKSPVEFDQPLFLVEPA